MINNKKSILLGVVIMVMIIEEDEKLCCNCQYFSKYYFYNEHHQIFTPCNTGSCTKVKTKLKHRTAYQKVCEDFKWKNGDGNV